MVFFIRKEDVKGVTKYNPLNYTNMIRNVAVNYKGVELTCKGYYTPYRDNGWDNPPDQESFEIDCVCYGETEITQLLNALNFDWMELESICIEELH